MPIENGMIVVHIQFRDIRVGDVSAGGLRVTKVAVGAIHGEVRFEDGSMWSAELGTHVYVWRHPPPDPLALLTAHVEASDARLIALIEEHRAVAARVEALERRPVYSVVEGVAGTNGRVPTYAEWSATVVPTGGVVPSVVHPADKRCGDTNGGYVCSRLVGHLHRHKAHEGHDVSARVCAEWGEEMEPEADPNAIGPWVEETESDYACRRFLNRPNLYAAIDERHSVRVHVIGDPEFFVVCTTRRNADALLARLYPTKEGAK